MAGIIMRNPCVWQLPHVPVFSPLKNERRLAAAEITRRIRQD